MCRLVSKNSNGCVCVWNACVCATVASPLLDPTSCITQGYWLPLEIANQFLRCSIKKKNYCNIQETSSRVGHSICARPSCGTAQLEYILV